MRKRKGLPLFAKAKPSFRPDVRSSGIQPARIIAACYLQALRPTPSRNERTLI
jgi:hypothetical protein